jgi:hypothetical protein
VNCGLCHRQIFLVLDVNDVGPTAGKDGDKIQVWRSLGTPNQNFLQ